MTIASGKRKIFWVLLIGAALAAGITWFVVAQVQSRKQDLADYIVTHPAETAVVAYTIDQNGAPIIDETALFYQADQPLVAASTMKIVVLAAYADAVVAGDLDPDEHIPVADWEQYFLPVSDGGAHVLGLQSVNLQADDHGFALDPAATVTLDDLARIMMHYSGNAATDYLLTRIGPAQVTYVMNAAGLAHHTPISLTLGPALAIFNHEYTSFTEVPIQTLVADVATGDSRHLAQLVHRYRHDPEWRAAQITFMTASSTETDVDVAALWAYQLEASHLLPTGTAREYAHLLAQVAGNQFISPEVSRLMQQKMETVSSDWPLRTLFYDQFGAKDGVTAGVLTLASYAVPKRGLLAGQTRVVVIMTNQLPIQTWTAQHRLAGHYLLQTDIATASGVFPQLAAARNE